MRQEPRRGARRRPARSDDARLSGARELAAAARHAAGRGRSGKMGAAATSAAAPRRQRQRRDVSGSAATSAAAPGSEAPDAEARAPPGAWSLGARGISWRTCARVLPAASVAWPKPWLSPRRRRRPVPSAHAWQGELAVVSKRSCAAQELEELRELKLDIERKEKQQAAIIDHQVRAAGHVAPRVRSGHGGHAACRSWRDGRGRQSAHCGVSGCGRPWSCGWRG